MKMRGVKNDARVLSSAFRGIYEKQNQKEEIVRIIQNRPLDPV
jgi:GTP cyclohydrolase I